VLASTTARPAPPTDGRWLIGRSAEHRELAFRLGERPDLLIVEADPLSGTSALLALALDALPRPVVAVDARRTGDAGDLATAIADAAVAALAPQAGGWWNGGPLDPEAARVARRLAPIAIDELRRGAGDTLARLRDALEVVAILGDGDALLAIDHLDTLLERLSDADARELLAAIRSERQRASAMPLLLIGRTGGRLARSLRDPAHALYRSGDVLAIHRATPRRFVDDLAMEGSMVQEPAALVAAAAELAAGSPAYVWRIVKRGGPIGGAPRARALTAWQGLCWDAAPQTAQFFEALASTQRAAPSVVCAISSGVAPYRLAINDKTVNAALNRLRARGIVFRPQPRNWAVSDPMLAAWARQHAPGWMRRVAGSAQ